jgi:hypothetical protein
VTVLWSSKPAARLRRHGGAGHRPRGGPALSRGQARERAGGG